MIQILAILGLTALVVVGFVFYSLRNLLLVSSPNEALILSGGTYQVGKKVVGYRSIRGGRAVRVPLLERVDRMDLSNIPMEIAVHGAYSKGGIPLNIQGIAHVKLPGHEPRLSSASDFSGGPARRSRPSLAKPWRGMCAACWRS